VRIDVGVATDTGRVRDGNEDSYLVEPPLYAVADGMGGARGGEVASQLALETVEELFREGKGSLSDQVREANRVVYQRSEADRKVAGMGTTLTAAVIEGERVRLAHVGDSRAYLLRAGSFRQLTEDHTLINRMLKAGEISSAEAEVHPHRNVLSRVLGTESDVAVDEERVGLLDGDRLVLCSDGLTSMVSESQIAAILDATAPPQEAADRLVRAANRAGGVDNITVVVLDVHDSDPDRDGSGIVTAGSELPPGHAAASPRPRSRRELDGASDAGSSRLAPAVPRPSGASLRRWLLVAAVVLFVVAAGLVAFRAYVDSQWYVGQSNGHVTVFQGIPASFLGYDLSDVEFESDIAAADAEAFGALPPYGSLAEGINANSREDADAIVDQIRANLREQRRNDRRQQGQQ
jgi:protein phosphatase